MEMGIWRRGYGERGVEMGEQPSAFSATTITPRIALLTPMVVPSLLLHRFA